MWWGLLGIRGPTRSPSRDSLQSFSLPVQEPPLQPLPSTEYGWAQLAQTHEQARVDAVTHTLDPMDLALGTMRELLNDPNACWRSRAQADAIRAVLGARTHQLLVLPTGAGKTMCFLVPA